MSNVARPGTQSHSEPHQAENGKDGAGNLKEKLLQCAPETMETSPGLRCGR